MASQLETDRFLLAVGGLRACDSLAGCAKLVRFQHAFIRHDDH
jgi:hypothetical protein